MDGERQSRESMLLACFDDDDDYRKTISIYNYVITGKKILIKN